MRILKWTLLVAGAGAVCYTYGRIKGILDTHSSIVVPSPMRGKFYVLGVWDFDETFEYAIQDLHASIASIYDEYMDQLEVQDLEKRVFGD